MLKNLSRVFYFFITLSFFSIHAHSEIIGELINNKANKVQKGNIGLVDTYNKRIIEIDNKGKVIWKKEIPGKFKNAEWNAGADIEWLSETDTFLIVAPKKVFLKLIEKAKY